MAFTRSPPGGSWCRDKSFDEASCPTTFVRPLPTPPAEYNQPFGFTDSATAIVAAAVAFPSMLPGPDPMSAPSFTARRPNAPNLPPFELPAPPLQLHKFASYPQPVSAPTATTLTSVGNLLTPPSNGSADGLSPTSSGLSSHGAVQPFSPNGSGMWHSGSATGSTPYGYQPGSTPQSFGQGRGIFSPSLNSVVRGSNSPTANEGLPPPPPYELSQYSQSMQMPAPNLPSLPNQQQLMGSGMMGGQHTPVSAPLSQASPVSGQDSFAPRPPPTPTASYYSQASGTPHQGSFSYSTGPSPILQSPMTSTGPLGKMSPVHQHSGSVPPALHSQGQVSYSQHRPYSYPGMAGPVLSNINNPGGHLALVNGGMSHGMMHFNSGTAAQMHHAMYAPHPQGNAQNDRPFRCDQCPQSFNRNHDLKRHKRIHLAVKPFPCGHCEKSFSRKDALKVRTVTFAAPHHS